MKARPKKPNQALHRLQPPLPSPERIQDDCHYFPAEYEIGMRFSEDMNTGENVDLEKIAKDGGAEAVEISDVYAAYALMTVPEKLCPTSQNLRRCSASTTRPRSSASSSTL